MTASCCSTIGQGTSGVTVNRSCQKPQQRINLRQRTLKKEETIEDDPTD
jgi:hypothetical protein